MRLALRICLIVLVAAVATGLGLWLAFDWMRGNEFFSMYGLVVDRQTGRPVAGASVKFELFRNTDLGVPLVRGQSSRMETVVVTSDVLGRFALQRVHGSMIRLVHVEAPGYFESPEDPYVVQGIVFQVSGMPYPKPPHDPKSPVKILLDPLPAGSP